MTDGWTIAAAVATSLSAIFVAWQAAETRRATSTSRRALLAAQAVAVDAAQARMDAAAPSLEVHLSWPSWPPFEPSTISSLGGKPQPLDAGREWHFPRDEKYRLTLRVSVHVKNLDSRKVPLSFTGAIREASESGWMPAQDILLFPSGESNGTIYFLEATFTAQDWAKNWVAHRDQKPLPINVEATISSADDRDTSAVDTWRLRLAGWPLQPVPDRDGVWRLAETPAGQASPGCVKYDVQPLRERTYWLSRSRNVKLPDPDYGPQIGTWKRIWKHLTHSLYQRGSKQIESGRIRLVEEINKFNFKGVSFDQ